MWRKKGRGKNIIAVLHPKWISVGNLRETKGKEGGEFRGLRRVENILNWRRKGRGRSSVGKELTG